MPWSAKSHGERLKEQRARKPDDRPSAAKRGYGRRWEKIRTLHLAREPLCRACKAEGQDTAATDVDHIKPKRAGGTDQEENLQSLCIYHHARKTASEDGGFGRR